MQPGSLGPQMGLLRTSQPGTWGGMQMSQPIDSRGSGSSGIVGQAASRGANSPGPRVPGVGRPLPPPSSSTRTGTASTQNHGLGSTLIQEQQRQGGGKKETQRQQDRRRRITSEIDQLLEGMSDDDNDNVGF